VSGGWHRRFAAAVAAEPRAEGDRRGVEREAATGRALQRGIERAQTSRQRVPDDGLDDAEAAADLFDRRRSSRPDLLGSTLREYSLLQVGKKLLAFRRSHVRAIPTRQRIRDRAVLLGERATGDRGGM